MSLLPATDATEVHIQGCVIRAKPNRLAKGRLGFRQLPLLGERGSEIHHCRREIRLEANCFAKRRLGFGASAESHQRLAEVEMILRARAAQRDSPGDELDRRFMFAGAGRDDAQENVRGSILRRGLKNCPALGFSLGEIPGGQQRSNVRVGRRYVRTAHPIDCMDCSAKKLRSVVCS